MIRFLDTNICIYFLKGEFPSIRDHLLSKSRSDIRIPAIVKAELQFGVEKSSRQKANEKKLEQFLAPYDIAPFDSEAAKQYGILRNKLEAAGTPVGGNDMFIAATVMAADGILVTANTREFSRIDGLRLENWTVPV